MTIDDAIQQLQEAKARGVKSVVLAWWVAEEFGMPDDDKWGELTDHMDQMDWSSTHDRLMEILNEWKDHVHIVGDSEDLES